MPVIEVFEVVMQALLLETCPMVYASTKLCHSPQDLVYRP